jgi:uncharacterized protein YecA (UPF0149 family)
MKDTVIEQFSQALKEKLGEERHKKLTDENIDNMLKAYYKAHTPWKRVSNQNRNDDCACGSGNKFKRCCGNKPREYTLNKKQHV